MRRLFPLLLLGCNPEIREAERRQEALGSEIALLEQEIAVLKNELRAAGIRVEPSSRKKGRPRAKRRGIEQARAAEAGTVEDHTEDLEPTFVRSGPLPAIPHQQIESTSGCGRKLALPDLKRISDFQLTQRGLGKASPVRMQIDGVDLRPHGFPKDFETCSGAFRHAGTVVLFSPFEEGADLGVLTLSFDERFPSPDADGRPRYWLHPGQRAVLKTHAPWDPTWGEAFLQLETEGGTPTLTLDGAAFEPGNQLPGAGPWTLEFAATEHTLVTRLSLGNTDHAVTITAP